MTLKGKTVLVTGGARRLGRVMALEAARAGADLIIHHGHSTQEAQETQELIRDLGKQASILKADFQDPDSIQRLMDEALTLGPLYALINSAAIFGSESWDATSLSTWNDHLQVNLTAPFLLSQRFASALPETQKARIINILDWRALRPGADHFAYTISKAGLAALTRSLAVALAPRITVNGLALGAILPPSGGEADQDLLDPVPADRWADLGELEDTIRFLLTSPGYITGEIIHLDGGRHLV